MIEPKSFSDVTYRPHAVLVFDCIDNFTGKITRHVYCFGLENEVAVLMGHVASYEANIRVLEMPDQCIIRYRGMEFITKRYFYQKGRWDEVSPFLNKFKWSNDAWFGKPWAGVRRWLGF